VHWFEEELRSALLSQLDTDPTLKSLRTRLTADLLEGGTTPDKAAETVLGALRRGD
jgi:hypothetical protein